MISPAHEISKAEWAELRESGERWTWRVGLGVNRWTTNHWVDFAQYDRVVQAKALQKASLERLHRIVKAKARYDL